MVYGDNFGDNWDRGVTKTLITLLTFRYTILERKSTQFSILYDILQRITNILTIRYRIEDRILSTFRISYEILPTEK